MTHDPITWQQIINTLLICFIFIAAGFKTAKHDSMAIAAVALAGAVTWCWWHTTLTPLPTIAVLFVLGYLPRFFWPEIRHWLGRYHNWSHLNPSKDAVITVTFWMGALAVIAVTG